MSHNPLSINALGILGGVVGVVTIGLLSPVRGDITPPTISRDVVGGGDRVAQVSGGRVDDAAATRLSRVGGDRVADSSSARNAESSRQRHKSKAGGPRLPQGGRSRPSGPGRSR
jgi:hypothetical protein